MTIRRFLIAAGNHVFESRNQLFPAVFTAVLLASRPRAPSGSADLWLDLAGVGLILAGQALRALTIGLTTLAHAGTENRIDTQWLVVHGAYRHCRNPLYAGNLLVFAGLFLVLDSPAGWLVGAPLFLFFFWAMTLAEEDFLERKFGAPYRGYRDRVRRFLCSPRGWRETLREPFDWRRVVRKEYGSTFAWITTLLVILGWEHVAWRGRDGAGAALAPLVAVWLVAAAGYTAVRVLKHSGRIESVPTPSR